MVLVDLTKAEIRRILTDLHRPFIYYEIEELKRPEALLWKKLNAKLTKALYQKDLPTCTVSLGVKCQRI